VKLVFLGPPGAGKGTQAQRMSDAFGWKHASTGDIFRQAVSEGSELGQSVRQFLDTGRLVPDELTSQVVEQGVIDRYDDFILDGYPRTLRQGEDLRDMLTRRDAALDAVLYFRLDDKSSVQRLRGRLVCQQCGANYHRDLMPPAADGVCDGCGGRLSVRSDTSEKIVRERLREYHEKTQPLLAHYEKRGLLREVDASVAADSVSEATRRVLLGVRSA